MTQVVAAASAHANDAEHLQGKTADEIVAAAQPKGAASFFNLKQGMFSMPTAPSTTKSQNLYLTLPCDAGQKAISGGLQCTSTRSRARACACSGWLWRIAISAAARNVSLAVCERVGFRPWLARTQEAYARLLRVGGNDDKAVALEKAALSTWKEIGAAPA